VGVEHAHPAVCKMFPMSDSLKVNRLFYDRLYGYRHEFLFLAHGRISFDQQAKSRLNYRILGPLIRRLVREHRRIRILDYGCGWGTFLLSLPRKRVEAYGYDISEQALRNLKRAMRLRGRRLETVVIDDQGTIQPNGFDIILCSHVLEHVSSDTQLIGSMVRALRPGGYLLINVPINELWEDPKHVHRYDARTLGDRIMDSGLRVAGCWEGDRWSSFLIKHRLSKKAGPLRRLGLRLVRAVLALPPMRFLRWTEQKFLMSYKPQQLLILGVKRNGEGSDRRPDASPVSRAGDHDPAIAEGPVSANSAVPRTPGVFQRNEGVRPVPFRQGHAPHCCDSADCSCPLPLRNLDIVLFAFRP